MKLPYINSWKDQLEKFISHYVWHCNDKQKNADGSKNTLRSRLECRLIEMKERRRRLIKYLYKKEGRLNEFEKGYQQSIDKKCQIIRKFSGVQLEELLKTSTKNVAQEVVSSLIPSNAKGVLAEIEAYIAKR